MSNQDNKAENIVKLIQEFAQSQFATKADLNKAFNELMKSLGSISDASNEKFSLQFLEHIRYLFDERNKYLQDNLQAFETTIKELADNVDSKNFSYEVKKFSKELEDIKSKVTEQENLFINLSRSIEEFSDKSDIKTGFENVQENLDAVSKGFKNVSSILNKNFTNLVAEVKKINNDQGFIDINTRLDGIIKSAGAIMSAIDIIDGKYQDIKGLIEFITNNESSLSRAISEFSKTTEELNEVMPQLKVVTTKGDLIILEDKINSINSFIDAFKDYAENANEQAREENLENLVYIKNKLLEMQGGNVDSFSDVVKSLTAKLNEIVSISHEELKRSLTGQIVYGYEQVQEKFSEGYNHLQENIKEVTLSLNNLDNTLSQKVSYEANQVQDNLSLVNKNLLEGLSKLREVVGEDFSNKLEPVKERLLDRDLSTIENIKQVVSSNVQDLKEILNKSLAENAAQNEIVESVEKEIKTVLIGVIDLKNQLENERESNSSLVQSYVEEVIKSLDNTLNQNDKLGVMSSAISNFSKKLEEAFQKIKNEADARELNAETQVIEKLNEVIPNVINSINEAKEQSETNYKRLYSAVKKEVDKGISTLKDSIEAIVSAVEISQKQVSQERIQEIKQDLQEVSNMLSATIQTANADTISALNRNSDDVTNLFKQVVEYTSGIDTRVENIKNIVEENSAESKKEISEAISNSTSKYIEFLNDIAEGILSKIIVNEENTSSNISALEDKIKDMAQVLFNSQASALNEEITSFTTKLDRINLQQISSVRELIDDFSGISSVQEKTNETLKTLITEIEDKLNKESGNILDKEELAILEARIMQNLQEEFSKQNQTFSAGFTRIANLNKSKGSDIALINEQIELLSRTLTQEFKGEFQKEYQAVVNGFARIISKQEENAIVKTEVPAEQVDFIIKNINQDFKGELQKNQQLLIEDITRILNSAKSRDESITALNERINLFSKTIAQDFKTELQTHQEALLSDIAIISDSQKNTEDILKLLTDKIELFSKTITKEVANELQNQQRIIVEDLAKMSSLNKDNEETIFDIREKLRNFEENIVQKIKGEIEQEQKSYIEELRSLKAGVLGDDFNKKTIEETQSAIENVGQSIIQEVRNELQTQQRILLNDLAKFDSDTESNKNTLSLVLAQTTEISKDIETKISEEIQNLKGLLATDIAKYSNVQDSQEESSLKIENSIQEISKEFDKKIKTAKEELLSEIQNIYIPEAIDEASLKSDINANIDNTLYVLQGEIDRVKDKIEEEVSNIQIPDAYNDEEVKEKLEKIGEDIKNIHIPEYDDTSIRVLLSDILEHAAKPEYDDSTIRALLNELSEKLSESKYDDTEIQDKLKSILNIIAGIKIPEAYNDEELKEKISELKENIENIHIPTYDDSEIKTLLNEVSDKVLYAKYDDSELKSGLRYISNKIDDIKVPEAYSDAELKEKISELKENIENIHIPTYDDTDVRVLLDEISEKISNIKIPDLDKDEIVHEINIASDIVKLNVKEELTNQLSAIAQKINEIYIPEVNEDKIVDNVSTSVLDAGDSIKSEVRELNYDLKEDLKDLTLEVRNEFDRIQDTIINEVSALENSTSNEELKKYVSSSIIQIKDGVEALKVEFEEKISSIQIPEPINEDELRITLIEAVNSISNKINEELAGLKNNILTIKIPEAYNDIELKDKLDDIKNQIEKIYIPTYDNADVKDLIKELSDKILNSKYDDTDVKNGLRFISSKIDEINIPDEINVEDLKNSIKSDIEKITSSLNERLNETHKELEEKISDIKIPEQQDLKKFKEDICDDTKNFIDNLKNELENTTNNISTQISQIKIPDSEILKEDINSNTNNAFCTLQNRIDELNDKIKIRIENLDIPEKYDDTALRQEIFNGIENVVENIKNEFEVHLLKIRDIVSSVNVPKEYDDSEVREKLDDIKNKIENIDIPKFDDNALREDIYTVKNHIDSVRNDVISKLDKVENVPDNEFFRKQFENINNEVELKINNLEEKIKEKISLIDLPQNLNRDELVNAISENVRGVVYEIANKTQDFREAFENSAKNITDKIDNFKPVKADDLEESTDLIIGVIRDKLKENTYVQNKFINSQLAQLLETISANDTDYILQKVVEKLEKIQNNNEYGLKEVEQDIKNVKIAVDRTNSIDMVKNLAAVKALTGENIKLNQHVEQQLSYANNWLRGAAKVMETLAQKIDDMEKARTEEKDAINTEKFENAAVNLAQKYKLQEKLIGDIEGKINTVIRKQNEGIDLTPFENLLQENARQTNTLVSRMNMLEDKMKTIEKSLERIVAFIES